jgi:TetR/AcrR family transcriptional regulator, transcriptional repressor for nem operon
MTRRPNVEARDCIIGHAFKLFFRRGFKGVSVEDVAEAAGMKKANVFHYYPDKEALGLAVLDRGAQTMKERFSSFLAKGKGDPIRAVDSLFAGMISEMDDTCCECGCFVGNAAQELSDDNEPFRQRIARTIGEWMVELKDLLARHRSAGYFRPSLDPEAVAQAILSMYEGAILISKAARDTHALESARRMAVEYLQVQRT